MNNGKKRKKRDRIPNIRSLDEMAEYRRWAKKEKWNYTLSTLLLWPVCCIVIGYLLIIGHFANVSSMQKVAGAVTINGTYKSIEYVDNYRAGSYYRIKLCESNESYVITDASLKGFDSQLFSDKMQPDMPITLTVSLKNTPNEKTPVYAVSTADFSFLSVEDTIQFNEKNNRLTLPIGFSFVMIGLVSLLIVSIVMYVRLRRIRNS